MTPSSGASLRGDLNSVLEQAMAADRFFIGDRILPGVAVPKKSGQYPILAIAAGELLTAASTNRTSTGSYGEITRAWTSGTYDTQDRGLEEPVGDTDAADMASYFNMEATAAKLVMRNMRLAAEVRVAAAIMATGTFTDAANSAVAYTEANIATIDFVRDVQAAIERVNDNGSVANTIVLSSAVKNRLERSTLLQNYMRGTLPSNNAFVLNSSLLQQLFADAGITQVLIGRARYNGAKKGQAYSATSVWGTTYVWVGEVQQAPNPEAMLGGGAGFTLYWQEDGGLYTAETYRNEQRRSNMVRVRQNSIEKIVNASAGTLITTQWA